VSAEGTEKPQERCLRLRSLGRSGREKPCRRAEPQERNAQRVASLGADDARNTGRTMRSASAEVEPGVGNPIHLLLACLAIL